MGFLDNIGCEIKLMDDSFTISGREDAGMVGRAEITFRDTEFGQDESIIFQVCFDERKNPKDICCDCCFNAYCGKYLSEVYSIGHQPFPYCGDFRTYFKKLN